jgi:hypothetical protein
MSQSRKKWSLKVNDPWQLELAAIAGDNHSESAGRVRRLNRKPVIATHEEVKNWFRQIGNAITNELGGADESQSSTSGNGPQSLNELARKLREQKRVAIIRIGPDGNPRPLSQPKPLKPIPPIAPKPKRGWYWEKF